LKPYPKDVHEAIIGNGIVATRGRIDHLIARRGLSDEEKEEIPEFERFIVEWNREKLGKERRSWIRNEVLGFLAEVRMSFCSRSAAPSIQ